jgi:plastocyanin
LPARIALTVLTAVLFAGLGWVAAAPADNPVLTGTVGPGFTISLTDAAGNKVTHLDVGTYTVKVSDRGDVHNFHLFGPGVDQATGVETTGDVEWTVTLTDGVYTYQCDPHAPVGMRGKFSVGSVTTTTPPPTPTAKLSGRVGPGAKIAFPAKARPGKARITVRDLSAADNFHLTGPGLNKKTGVTFKGTVTWSVTLKRGVYRYRSDAHSALRGSTKVS